MQKKLKYKTQIWDLERNLTIILETFCQCKYPSQRMQKSNLWTEPWHAVLTKAIFEMADKGCHLLMYQSIMNLIAKLTSLSAKYEKKIDPRVKAGRERLSKTWNHECRWEEMAREQKQSCQMISKEDVLHIPGCSHPAEKGSGYLSPCFVWYYKLIKLARN